MAKSDADIARIAAACAKQLRKDQKRARDFARSAQSQRWAYELTAQFPRRVYAGRAR